MCSSKGQGGFHEQHGGRGGADASALISRPSDRTQLGAVPGPKCCASLQVAIAGCPCGLTVPCWLVTGAFLPGLPPPHYMFAAPQHAQHAYAPPCAFVPARLQPASAARGVQQPSAWVLAPAGQAQHAQPPAVQHDLAMRRRWRAASGGLSRRQDTAPPETALVSRLLRSSNISAHWFCVCRLYQKHQTAVQREYAAWPGFPIAQTAGAGVCKRSVFQVGNSDLRSHQGPRRRQAAAPGAVRRCVPPRTRCCCIPAAAAAASTQSAAVAAATATPAAASAPQCTRALLRTAAPVAARRCL